MKKKKRKFHSNSSSGMSRNPCKQTGCLGFRTSFERFLGISCTVSTSYCRSDLGRHSTLSCHCPNLQTWTMESESWLFLTTSTHTLLATCASLWSIGRWEIFGQFLRHFEQFLLGVSSACVRLPARLLGSGTLFTSELIYHGFVGQNSCFACLLPFFALFSWRRFWVRSDGFQCFGKINCLNSLRSFDRRDFNIGCYFD